MFLPITDFSRILPLLGSCPQAEATITGNSDYPRIFGHVSFYQTPQGVLTTAQVWGLPAARPGGIFAFHIHSGSQCSGNESDPFADALTHYNPTEKDHPYHAGDLPPLFSSGGHAFEIFLTDRFSVQNIIGKTVIIHAGADDFTSQPAGNAGAKIACGVIVPGR